MADTRAWPSPEPGDRIRINWQGQPATGIVTDDHWRDGSIGVRIDGLHGATAKVPRDLCPDVDQLPDLGR